MTNINTNKPYNTSQVARIAIKRMQEVTDIYEANRIGDVFLSSIKEQSTGEDEKDLAEFALEATKTMYKEPRLKELEKNAKIIAFEFLAEGINCPTGQALAKVASRTLKTEGRTVEENWYPRTKPVRDAYMRGIELYGTENEKLVASIVRKATSGVDTTFSDNVERMTFEMVADGVNKENPGTIVKNLGHRAMKCDGVYDGIAPKIAETFLKAVGNEGNPEEKLIARLGIDASIQEGCTQSFHTLNLAMDTISNGIEAPISHVIFEMIKNVHRYNASTLFAEFEKTTEDKNNAAIACAAGRMIGTGGYQSTKDYGLPLAIDMIEKGMNGSPEKNLMKFYREVDEKQRKDYQVITPGDGLVYNSRNEQIQRFTKESLLKAVAKYADNPENRAIAKNALVKTNTVFETGIIPSVKNFFETGIIPSLKRKDNINAMKIYEEAAHKIINNIKEEELKNEIS